MNKSRLSPVRLHLLALVSRGNSGLVFWYASKKKFCTSGFFCLLLIFTLAIDFP